MNLRLSAPNGLGSLSRRERELTRSPTPAIMPPYRTHLLLAGGVRPAAQVVSRGRMQRASLTHRLQVVCLLVGVFWAASPPGTARAQQDAASGTSVYDFG